MAERMRKVAADIEAEADAMERANRGRACG